MCIINPAAIFMTTSGHTHTHTPMEHIAIWLEYLCMCVFLHVATLVTACNPILCRAALQLRLLSVESTAGLVNGAKLEWYVYVASTGGFVCVRVFVAT